MSNRVLFLLIMLTTFINVGYASFPVSDTLIVKQDTLQIEEIKKYHDHLIKMGINLNSCKCVSCRDRIAPLSNNSEVKKLSNQFQTVWLPIIIVMVILSTILIILLYRYVDKSSGEASPLG